MSLIWEGLHDAFRLVCDLDPSVMDAATCSVWISSLAVALSTVVGLPIGILLARISFPGRRLVIVAFRASMAFPTVFIGLVGFSIFSRQGPLGAAGLLYTPWAIVLGEFLLATPIIVSLCHGAVRALDVRVGETAQTLGAGVWRRLRTYLSEARIGITLAVLTAFSRCVTELGIAMMVGGNIRNQTRTLATATAFETSKGEFGRGMAMGLILLIIALGVMIVIVSLGQEEKNR